MQTRKRHFFLDEDRISSTVSQQAAAEARWLAGANSRRVEATARNEREHRIRQQAYLRAQRRDFAPGAEVEDWLAAEREVDSWIRRLQ